MTDYLSYQFQDSEKMVNTFDEAPLWSAAFGLLLLKHLELRSGLTVLDLGCGAGFPLMELAGRMGTSCRLIGVDPWVNALNRARQKIENYGLTNVEVVCCSAATMPFPDASVDLIVSNLGINNFDDPATVFAECNRVLKSGGRLALTTNLYGHWKVFYEVFYDTLQGLKMPGLMEQLQREERHRGTRESVTELFNGGNLNVTKIYEETYLMKFIDGSAFLNHYFVKLGWLSSWRDLIPQESRQRVFYALEQNLNSYAASHDGELRLEVPMAYFEGVKG